MTDTTIEEPPASKRRTGLSGMLLADLRKLAADRGMSGASSMRKSELIAALGGSLVYLDDTSLNSVEGCGLSLADLIGLVGVAEPAALVLAKQKEWCMRKTVYGRLTVAIAR